MAHRFNQHDIESILNKIRKKLIYKMDNDQLGSLELHGKEDAITLDFTTKKSVAKKKDLLNELAGSGLHHGLGIVDDAVRVANRKEEGDREGLNLG